MTEKDLKDLGFKKVKVSAYDSGATPYYYYKYSFGKRSYLFELLSSDSDNLKKNKWQVFLYEGNFRPLNKSQIKKYIRLINSLKK